MTTDNVGVYLHIPYCIRRCNYCDFCSSSSPDGAVPDAYVDRLVREINEYSSFGKIGASSVYFGGGTPSLLTPIQLERIVSALKQVFDFKINTEFTIEANPGTVTIATLREFRKIGVNRLSFGVQTLVDGELSALGRIHNSASAKQSFKMARDAGFDNVSIDLMYGIPHQTRESFLYTLSEAASLSPEHISVYGLIVEEGTPFYARRDTLPIPSAGDSHYEISNYARDGKYSQHNLKYWHLDEYVGIGASAASYFRGRRYQNSHDIGEYMKGGKIKFHSAEEEAIDDEKFSYAMMNLRLREGLSLEKYRARFGEDFLSSRGEYVEKLSEHFLIELNGDALRLTDRGFYVSNTILSDLL